MLIKQGDITQSEAKIETNTNKDQKILKFNLEKKIPRSCYKCRYRHPSAMKRKYPTLELEYISQPELKTNLLGMLDFMKYGNLCFGISV